MAEQNRNYQSRLDSIERQHDASIRQHVLINALLEKQVHDLQNREAPLGSYSSNNEKIIQELRSELEAAQRNNTKQTTPLPSPTPTAPRIVQQTVYRDSTQFIIPESLPGKIAFYCPDEMREEHTYEVSASLGYLFSNDDIKKELLEAVNEVRQERGETALTIDDMVSKDIMLGCFMKIQLIDPGNKFNIMVPANYPKQDEIISLLDADGKQYAKKEFSWKWLVTPKENSSGQAALKIIITPYNKAMQPQTGKERDFLIQVKFKKSLLGGIWDKAHRNPEWAVASIITPLLTFFAGKLFGKKKEAENK